MSSEIVPFLDGSDTPSADPNSTGKVNAVVVEHLTDSDAILRRPLGAIEEDVRPFDLLGLRSVECPTDKFDLISGNQDMRHFLPPARGPKYTTRLNPTPKCVKPLLEKIKEPSVLQLRGCDHLFSPEASPFPFEKFKTLTCLEISGVSNLTTLPENIISEMTQLQALNLSHLPIQQLPTHFFSNLIHLRSLTLKDCPNILSLPKPPQMTALEYLELSHLLIETLPVGFFSGLTNLEMVILRGCSKLTSLPSIQPLEELEVLDLSHCTVLQDMEPVEFGYLRKLDLSYTALHFTSTLCELLLLTHLFLRDAKVVQFEGFYTLLISLEVLDVSGAQCVNDLDLFEGSEELEALDLSRTGIESIDFISGVVNLRYLILRDCTRLKKLPAMEELTHLEVLDISGCEILIDLPEDVSSLKKLKELNLSGCSGLKELSPGLFDQMSCLEKLDLSKTNINHLPSFANLTDLRTLNISHTSVEEVPNFSNLKSLREFFIADCHKLKGVAAASGSGEIDFIKDQKPRVEGRLSKPSEFHIVSTFFSSSGFDRFKKGFDQIVNLISSVHEDSKPTSSLVTIPTPTTPTAMNDADNSAASIAASCHISSQNVKRDCRRMVADLKYIRDNIGLLESCHHCTIAEKLLDKLTYLQPAANSRSPFSLQLYSTVAKLKLLVPRKNVDEKKDKFEMSINYDQQDVPEIDINTPEMQSLSSSYDSLTNIQKKCLLHFTVLQSFAEIKERILIHLWYGEGFIDPQPVENVALSNANSSTNPLPTPNQNLNIDQPAYSNPNPEIMSMSTEAAKGVEVAQTIEEIGRKILRVLEEKNFIVSFGPYDREPRSWGLKNPAHIFLRARAKAERFFNVDHETGKLTPHFTGSQRACLLQSEDNLPPSCQLWRDYINSSEKLESFKTIRTLLNVNAPILDIRPEWFSKMRNLTVVHLWRWHNYKHEAIEAVDFKFLEELKNMKQLRLLSLERFLTIKKLPDSICKVTNLRILNLRECSYLEELPAGIGSLKNLTHLDLTNCPILSKLPKGIRLLSKLEVLKGFVIYYQIGGRQHRNACTLRELLMLEKLRVLKLVVHTDMFPDSSDLHVFNGMKNLCNLQITWQKNYNDLNRQQQDVDGPKALRQYSSGWQKLKCWEQQTRQNDTEELLRCNLKKLELRCFPSETALNWLQPSGLQKLEKLYVRGGMLSTLVGDTNQNTWNVKTLVLTYLPNMCMDWEELRHNFPHMTHLYRYECDLLSSFPFNDSWGGGRIWRDKLQ